MHVTLAVAAGSVLALFAVGAALVLREGREAAAEADVPTLASATFRRVAATSFGVVFIAELGDLTQISTANLAARFDSPVAVCIGALAALWPASAAVRPARHQGRGGGLRGARGRESGRRGAGVTS